MVKRHGKMPAKHASRFLSSVTAESIIQLGLLADAGYESLKVIRFYDTDNFDLSDMSDTLCEYVHRIDMLFVKGTATGQQGWWEVE